MTLGVLGVGYLVAGGLAVIVAGCAGRLGSAIDALLLVTLWPLWLPLSLAKRGDLDDHELIDALGRARSSPLAGVLPDAENARPRDAPSRGAARLAELDALLARRLRSGAVERHASGSRHAARLAPRRPLDCACARRQLHALRERYRTSSTTCTS